MLTEGATTGTKTRFTVTTLMLFDYHDLTQIEREDIQTWRGGKLNPSVKKTVDLMAWAEWTGASQMEKGDMPPRGTGDGYPSLLSNLCGLTGCLN
jgi:hypothetical protein